MDLKSIVLQHVEFEEFEDLKKFWNKQHFRVSRGDTLFRIKKPISNTSYVCLLNSLLECPRLKRISVNRKGWKSYSPGAVAKRTKEFAEYIADDPHRVNYFEAKFGNSIEDEYAKVGFIEHHDLIIGYEMEIPNSLLHFFSRDEGYAHRERNRSFVLWVPEEGFYV